MPRSLDLLRAALLTVAVLGCADRSPGPILTGREWTVVAIDTIQAPVGSGGRPITMRFDDSTRRVYGFGGCNQYNAGYTLSGDSISFGPGVSTRMSCAGYDAVEHTFLASFADITTVTWDGSILIMSGHGRTIRATVPAR
jgi:heat shock protein HslJ